MGINHKRKKKIKINNLNMVTNLKMISKEQFKAKVKDNSRPIANNFLPIPMQQGWGYNIQ